ncbi:hypothetical protein C4E22_06450 [ANME-1 cluster archaeon AG-394-G06]|nr:hypothetical protein [ANME-1 cluster archaeon AG-394-G06]
MVHIRKGDEHRRDSTVKGHVRHTPQKIGDDTKKMKRGVSTRSRWEIIQDILDVIATMENRAKKTRIMKMAYLDWKNFHRHFGFLIDGGFIVEIDDPSKGISYGLTERGKELRSKLKDLELIVSV